MTIRNILVAFNGSESATCALRYAAALAGEQAHVTALLAHSNHEVVDSHGRWVPPRAREIIAAANAEIVTEISARFDALRDDLGLGARLHFVQAAGRVDAVLSEAARNFDILVLGQDRAEGVDSHVSLHPDRIALLAGRPVLVVPRGYTAGAGHARAVLAWDGSRSAARAMSDSLALLEAQGEVSVITLGDAPLPRPAEEVITHLARHGIAASHARIPAVPGPARALVAHMRETAPSLLVMGAYEHSKFREDFLGGVTTRVLRDTPVPVLLSH
ncbi:UspA domain protein [Ruegeria lacuscaerulensis ITI-1157]|nr:UspA domain protein [Ruegeria lacuscaerulensis ITI-1157]SHJ36725.1 Universal stress protein family protein [Ruegeria lacuscaerulensis ITI-1157]